MQAAALRFELHLPDCHSLKEKRSVLRPLVDGLRSRVSVSVAEVDHHDRWQRAALGVAVVAGDPGRLDQLVETVRRFVDEQTDLEIMNVAVSYLDVS